MLYDVPGRADSLSTELIQQWNQTIQEAYNRLGNWKNRFFTLDPSSLKNPVRAPIKWFGDPAEPAFCLDEPTAKQLCDWGVPGRHILHNEYCEYRIIEKLDATGKMRPKRVQVTTELREYWACIAKFDPVAVRAMVENVLGFLPSWEALYGVSDPSKLSPRQREVAFSQLVAGHGNKQELVSAGVPEQPVGALNQDNALFMTHPINGLDDLLYIVMFGAAPYVIRTETGLKSAIREQIFRQYNVEALACRHADPAAAMGAQGAAMNGQTVAFDNPLGMYILSFNHPVFRYQDEAVPQEWIRFSRGEKDMYQRLEFGPSDTDEAFLDDIVVEVGSDIKPLTGGFQVLQQIEIGPIIVVGEPTPVAEDEYVILRTSSEPIRCRDAGVCDRIYQLKQQYDTQSQIGRIGPRQMGVLS
ncbi:hypothetical protein [Laspinema olomoucense]|uniref:hypothetical protein n=1 Tax=Laspinema olomoucense TaxID=3231600 RepID=UPI0021BA9076|nr:hypothetical protein [Laspinema sp. D3d]MCT7975167.1 hypothetical protein [Laspinema sp. D3d]